uniref:2-oxoglutarate dehydrogenase E1 component N-terminal domain-containing protein n=1 Tax=Timema cristinae TaxID=61476 RepID=A0A7R9GZD9_TIMCR|nr:unnamed protein product [Timema cristinae]
MFHLRNAMNVVGFALRGLGNQGRTVVLGETAKRNKHDTYNKSYVEAMFESWLKDRASVHKTWDIFFKMVTRERLFGDKAPPLMVLPKTSKTAPTSTNTEKPATSTNDFRPVPKTSVSSSVNATRDLDSQKKAQPSSQERQTETESPENGSTGISPPQTGSNRDSKQTPPREIPTSSEYKGQANINPTTKSQTALKDEKSKELKNTQQSTMADGQPIARNEQMNFSKRSGEKKQDKPYAIIDETKQSDIADLPPDRDSNLNIPVINSSVYCESDALDHAATEVGYNINHGDHVDKGASLLLSGFPSTKRPGFAPLTSVLSYEVEDKRNIALFSIRSAAGIYRQANIFRECHPRVQVLSHCHTDWAARLAAHPCRAQSSPTL